MSPASRTKAAPAQSLPAEYRRVIVEGVSPEIDAGRFPIKRVVGEPVIVQADIFTDGHDEVSGALLYRREGESDWVRVPMAPLGNDRWEASFSVEAVGRYEYTVQGWVDAFKTWSHDLSKRLEAGQNVSVDLQIGADIVEAAADRAPARDARSLRTIATSLRAGRPNVIRDATSDELAELMARNPDLDNVTSYANLLSVVVDRDRARFSAWYEMFPRSSAAEPGKHGTFRDLEARLPYVRSLGFDVLYLPPIHPIGQAFRKGKNNNTVSVPGEPGSPWAIGSSEGGHTAIHPELGTLDEFRRLVQATRDHGLEIAMDIAFQCSPDHPYTREHPEWFRQRPDGTIQYAENPPKKYQDIYPFDFGSPDWRGLWDELRRVVQFWVDQGVRIFRVDNPHTKPFPFWEWLIAEIKRAEPDVLFLSEAFTRPKVMYRLAKLGFTQSYTYFAWRNSAAQLREYLTELTRTSAQEFFRPNLWPNTPDILTAELQNGGRPAFASRLVLAATLGASYGIYGPAFELLEHRPLIVGGEEYLNSEKYEIRHWNLEDPNSLAPLISQVNRIRREHPALRSNQTLRFHELDNPQMLAYSKTTESLDDTVIMVVNLDPSYTQSGWLDLDLPSLGIEVDRPFEVHDLISDERYAWHGSRNYVELNPKKAPAHILYLSRDAPRLVEQKLDSSSGRT